MLKSFPLILIFSLNSSYGLSSEKILKNICRSAENKASGDVTRSAIFLQNRMRLFPQDSGGVDFIPSKNSFGIRKVIYLSITKSFINQLAPCFFEKYYCTVH